MAAKSKVKSKTTKTQNKAAAKGLQLSSQQWKAYSKAFTATRNKLAIQAASKRFRAYRLNAAHATLKKYAATRAAVSRAAIAANASRMSWNQSKLGHQNAALQGRIEMDMYHHANLLGRAQFVRAGEAKYAARAVMRTVTSAQATSYETKLHKAVYKTAKKASKSTTVRTPAQRAASQKIIKAASAAGLKAAKKAKGRAAPRLGPGAGHALVKPYLVSPVSASHWHGDETSPNCVIVAVANHLKYHRGFVVTQENIDKLTRECGNAPSIEQVLWEVYISGWPGTKVRLSDYREVPSRVGTGLVIGYEAETEDGLKPHAALLFGDGEIVSWGSVAPFNGDVEEAWELKWLLLPY